MRALFWSIIGVSTAFLFSCQREPNSSDSHIVSQQFIHKYGFPLSQEEWKERKEEGQIITLLDSGITLVQSFSNGVLHGPTTYSFPYEETVQTTLVYNEGTLLQKTLHDSSGNPIQQEVCELDDQKTITQWNKKGVPLSIEEMKNDLLWKGQYFTADNELEAFIEEGTGTRIQRDPNSNLLLAKEIFTNGKRTAQTIYYINGHIQSQASFLNDQLHGKQLFFSYEGDLESESQWKEGQLHGVKTIYKQGKIEREISYLNGLKHGIERIYGDNEALLAEIYWDKNLKHGRELHFENDKIDTQWYFKGKKTTAKLFQQKEQRERLITKRL